MRLIDADALIERNDLTDCVKHRNKSTEQRNHSYSTMMLYEIKDMIDDAPTVDAQPVVHAHWIDEGDPATWKCSNCSYGVMRYNNTAYCPNCGAKMDGKSTRND